MSDVGGMGENPPPVRTAEVVAVLALAGDLAGGLPFQHGLRSTCHAAELALALDLDPDAARQVYYATALSCAGKSATDLATLLALPVDLSAPADAMIEPIIRIANQLDLLRSRHSPAVAAAMVLAGAQRPGERRAAVVALKLEPVPDDEAWERMLAAEPAPQLQLTGADVDTALAALGMFGSLVSPYFRGHSATVSALAALVAQERGLAADQIRLVRQAALVHDLGRTGVARELWEWPGPLDDEDWTRVRTGTEQSTQLLARVPWLAELGEVAAPNRDKSEVGEILAAANAYCAMLADRPHRPAMSPAAAATALRADAIAGRFDDSVVESVIRAAAGQPVGRL